MSSEPQSFGFLMQSDIVLLCTMHQACDVGATTAMHSSGLVSAVEQSSNRSIFESLSCQATFSSEANSADTSRSRVEGVAGLTGSSVTHLPGWNILSSSPSPWRSVFRGDMILISHGGTLKACSGPERFKSLRQFVETDIAPAPAITSPSFH